MLQSKKVIKMNIGNLSIYEGHIAAIEIDSVDIVEIEDVKDVLIKCTENIDGNFALISNRKKEYSIDPISLYSLLNSCEQLKCAAIVAYRPATEKLYNVEKVIEEDVSSGDLPLEMFSSLESAVEWASEILG